MSDLKQIVNNKQVLDCIYKKGVKSLKDLNLKKLNNCMNFYDVDIPERERILILFMRARDKILSNKKDDSGYQKECINNKNNKNTVYSNENREKMERDSIQESSLDEINTSTKICSELKQLNDMIDKRLDSSQFYFYTKTKSLPLISLLKDINKIIVNNEYVSLDLIYRELRSRYQVKSFNKKRLSDLIGNLYGINDFKQYEPKKCFGNLKKYLMSLSSGYSKKRYLIQFFNQFQKLEKLIGIGYLNCLSSYRLNYTYQVINSIIENPHNTLNYKFNETDWLIEAYIDSHNYFKSYFNSTIFLDYVYVLENENELINDIEYIVETVHEDNLNILLSRLFNNVFVEKLNQFDITYIDELIETIIEKKHYEIIKYNLFEIYDTLVNLQSSFKKSLLEDLLTIKNDNLEILKARSSGKSLQYLGDYYGLTRERIRQKEQASQSRIEKLLFKEVSIGKRFKTLIRNIHFITKNDLKIIYGDYAEAVLYSLKNLSIAYSYNDLDFVSMSEFNWLKIIDYNIKLLPSTIHEDYLDLTVNKFKKFMEYNNINLRKQDIKNILLSKYFEYGDYYSKTKLNLSDKYEIVLQHYFKDGLHLYDKNQMDEFKKITSDVFKDKEIISKSNRSIEGVIQRFANLIDSGTYTIIDEDNVISDTVLETLKEYIKSANHPIMLKGLYDIFNDLLVNEGIVNHVQLHDVLKKRLDTDNMFHFTRDTVYYGDKKITVREVIYEFIRNKGNPIDYESVFEFYPTYNKSQVYNAVAESENIFILGNSMMVHQDNVHLSYNSRKTLYNLINSYLNENDFIPIETLYEAVFIFQGEIVRELQVEHKQDLFGKLNAIFKKNFYFKYPFISHQDAEVIAKKDQAYRYFYDNEGKDISIQDFNRFLDERKIKIINKLDFIESLYPDFIRIDVETLVRSSSIIIKKESLIKLKVMFFMLFRDRDKIDLSKFVNYDYLPEINYPWNMYLLGNIARYYFSGITLEYSKGTYLNATIILKKTNRIELIEWEK